MSKKWNCELDKEFNTVTWLKCEMVMASGKKMVKVLKCSAYSKYRIRIESSRNFSDRWIVGAESLCTNSRSWKKQLACASHVTDNERTYNLLWPRSFKLCSDCASFNHVVR